MSTTVTAPTPIATANEYFLQDHSGQTKVIYYPVRPGPPQPGQTKGPSLSYMGPAGSFAFVNDQIQSQDSPLGQMLTVVLRLPGDIGGETFTLFLPTVLLDATHSAKFTTVSVTATKTGNIIKPGAQMSYQFEQLHGTAKVAIMDL